MTPEQICKYLNETVCKDLIGSDNWVSFVYNQENRYVFATNDNTKRIAVEMALRNFFRCDPSVHIKHRDASKKHHLVIYGCEKLFERFIKITPDASSLSNSTGPDESKEMKDSDDDKSSLSTSSSRILSSSLNCFENVDNHKVSEYFHLTQYHLTNLLNPASSTCYFLLRRDESNCYIIQYTNKLDPITTRYCINIGRDDAPLYILVTNLETKVMTPMGASVRHHPIEESIEKICQFFVKMGYAQITPSSIKALEHSSSSPTSSVDDDGIDVDFTADSNIDDPPLPLSTAATHTTANQTTQSTSERRSWCDFFRQPSTTTKLVYAAAVVVTATTIGLSGR